MGIMNKHRTITLIIIMFVNLYVNAFILCLCKKRIFTALLQFSDISVYDRNFKKSFANLLISSVNKFCCLASCTEKDEGPNVLLPFAARLFTPSATMFFSLSFPSIFFFFFCSSPFDARKITLKNDESAKASRRQ